MKKCISLLLCAILLLSSMPAFAQSQAQTPIVDTSDATALAYLNGFVALCVDRSHIFYAGEKHETDAPARIIDSRTLVPVRAVSEAFFRTVNWNDKTQTVTIE